MLVKFTILNIYEPLTYCGINNAMCAYFILKIIAHVIHVWRLRNLAIILNQLLRSKLGYTRILC